jgi:hypothetical protein
MYVRAEFNVCLTFFKHVITEKMKQAHGNPFA